jgi:TolA-binding protein
MILSAGLAFALLLAPGVAGAASAGTEPLEAPAPDGSAAASATAEMADDDFAAARLYASKQYEQAAEEAVAFLGRRPDDPEAPGVRLVLARSLAHLDRFDDAATALEEIRHTAPAFDRLDEVVFDLGQIEMARGRLKEAVAVFDEFLRGWPDHNLADWARARQGEGAAALKQYDQAEAILAPIVRRYLTGRDADRNLKAARERIEKGAPGAGPAFDALLERAHLDLGLARFGAGRYDAARQTLEEFLALSPRSPLAETARFHLAQSVYRTGALDRAADLYAEVGRGTGPLAPVALFERALALYQLKKYRDASGVFLEAARRFPQADRAAAATLYAGTCLYQAGDWRAALERLGERLQAAPTDTTAMYWLGLTQLKDNKPGEAEASLRKVLAAASDTTLGGDARLALGDTLVALGRTDEAADAYQSFVKDLPVHPRLRRGLYGAAALLHKMGRYNESEKLCDRLLEGSVEDDLSSQALFLSGENRFLLKDYPAAVERYTTVAETRANSPEAPTARLQLAWIEYFGGNHEAALLHLDRLDVRRADKAVAAEAVYLRGNCLLEMKDNDKAADAFGRFLAAPGPHRDDALLRLALAQSRTGKTAESIGRLAQLLREYPAGPLVPEAEYQLAEMLLAAGGREDEAIAHYQAFADKFAGHRLAPYAAFGLGLAQLKKGAADAAAATFTRVAEAYPQTDLAPQALYQKSLALQKALRVDEATAVCRTLLEKYPDHELATVVTLSLGTRLQTEKKFDEAAAFFRPLADLARDARTREQAAYELAWSLQQAGKDREAVDAYRALAEKFPGGALAADAWFQLAESTYQEKRYADAAALYEKVLAASRDGRLRDKALFRLGWCRRHEDKWPESAACFDRLVAETPASELVPEALLGAAEGYLRDGRPADAVPRLTRLLDPKFRDFPHLAEARLRLGESQLLLGRSEEAAATLSAIEASYPNFRAVAEIHCGLGKALLDLRRYAEARPHLEKALALASAETAAKAQFYLGQTLLETGNPQAALKAYARVATLWGAYKEWAAAAQFGSGLCYLRLRNTVEARGAFMTVADKYGDTMWASPAREQLNR